MLKSLISRISMCKYCTKIWLADPVQILILHSLSIWQPQPSPQRELIRPAAKWGTSTFPSQASGSNRHPTSAHAHHPSVVVAHPTLGNQAIGVLTTDQNAVPSTSRENALHRPPLPVKDSLPIHKDPSASAHSVNQANSVLLAPPTTESGQSDSARKIDVVIWPRTERPTKRPRTPQETVLVEVRQNEQPAAPLSPARLPASADNERPGPSAPREPLIQQAPDRTSLDILVKGVVSLLISTSRYSMWLFMSYITGGVCFDSNF